MNIEAIGTMLAMVLIVGFAIGVIFDDPYKQRQKSDGGYGGGGFDGSDCGGDAGGCD